MKRVFFIKYINSENFIVEPSQNLIGKTKKCSFTNENQRIAHLIYLVDNKLY